MSNTIIVDGVAGDVLRQYIERVERLEQEKADIMEQIREIYAAAKSEGLEPSIMKRIVKTRKMKPEDLDEQETLFEVYKRALGMESKII